MSQPRFRRRLILNPERIRRLGPFIFIGLITCLFFCVGAVLIVHFSSPGPKAEGEFIGCTRAGIRASVRAFVRQCIDIFKDSNL